jgi:hypothetical protein
VVNADEEVLAPRTHTIGDRLPWRIFGLPYAHPHPLTPNTTVLRNKDGLPLPTDFDGGFAEAGLADAAERDRRAAAMQAVCAACHDASWVTGHWTRFEAVIRETNEKTRLATDLVRKAWAAGLAEGPGAGNPFDEPLERDWTDVWLFHANSIRFAAAMAGGGDYAVFANGHHELSRRLADLHHAVGKPPEAAP